MQQCNYSSFSGFARIKTYIEPFSEICESYKINIEFFNSQSALIFLSRKNLIIIF